MKKLVIATCMMLGFAGVVCAQKTATTTASTTKTDTKLKPVKPAVASTKPAKVVKMDKPVSKTQTATTKPVTKGPTKADGTLDMRYNVNKNATKTVTKGPTKADGTPDMRFNSNKTAPKTKTKTKS